MFLDEDSTPLTLRPQNRELQIMRIVHHPNIVDLKAFYYSNGERVSPAIVTVVVVFFSGGAEL